MEKEWYVVNTYSGHEYKVKEKLESKIESMGLQDNIFRIVIPETTEVEVKNGVKTLMMVTFEETTSHEKTLNAITEIREIMDDKANIGGMSAIVKDTMDLSNKEVLIYVVIAVVLCLVVLTVSLDSYVVPFILLGNIGIAIIYNMGTNIMFGEISYITKAISAVLQLGVTIDFSIF